MHFKLILIKIHNLWGKNHGIVLWPHRGDLITKINKLQFANRNMITKSKKKWHINSLASRYAVRS